jgi:hypothetical protein
VCRHASHVRRNNCSRKSVWGFSTDRHGSGVESLRAWESLEPMEEVNDSFVPSCRTRSGSGDRTVRWLGSGCTGRWRARRREGKPSRRQRGRQDLLDAPLLLASRPSPLSPGLGSQSPSLVGPWPSSAPASSSLASPPLAVIDFGRPGEPGRPVFLARNDASWVHDVKRIESALHAHHQIHLDRILVAQVFFEP